MELRFWTDPETGLAHIYNHGVSELEVYEIIHGRGQECPGRDSARIRIGQTETGRYLQVVYVPDPDGLSAFVVTAFELSNKAKKAFRRRRRRKPR